MVSDSNIAVVSSHLIRIRFSLMI